jgi:hypothetical protein
MCHELTGAILPQQRITHNLIHHHQLHAGNRWLVNLTYGMMLNHCLNHNFVKNFSPNEEREDPP